MDGEFFNSCHVNPRTAQSPNNFQNSYICQKVVVGDPSQLPPPVCTQSGGAGSSSDDPFEQPASVVGIYGDAGSAYQQIPSLVTAGRTISKVAGPLGTALSAGQFAYNVANGNYADATFTALDFGLAVGLSTTGPVGIAADAGINLAGGTKAAATGLYNAICPITP